MAPLIGLFSSTLLAAFFIWIDWQPITGFRFDWVWHGLCIASPLFGSTIVAALRRRVTTSFYFVLGFLAGAVGFAQMMLLFAIGRMDKALEIAQNNDQLFVPIMPDGWVWSLILYPIAGAFLAVVGGKLGEQLARHPQAEKDQGQAETGARESVERWLKALAPYFGAIATLLGVLFAPKH